jgi:hypothetical protein
VTIIPTRNKKLKILTAAIVVRIFMFYWDVTLFQTQMIKYCLEIELKNLKKIETGSIDIEEEDIRSVMIIQSCMQDQRADLEHPFKCADLNASDQHILKMYAGSE